ncbi:hypothetical protein L6164_001392 [Bauhinia variegata]|uniref:Uncharacterized protein n=1 Tax=Bauhinia variegata TaxID=167791 RepID=A0ACB9QAR9_BAUVA|nr:hypothetical protein L6164_001392 [Bauhinia variegata]
MDRSELKHILIGLDVEDLKVKAFRTYHVIPNQISYTLTEPEIAFTGDTTSDFIVDESNIDVLRARILIMEKPDLEESLVFFLWK